MTGTQPGVVPSLEVPGAVARARPMRTGLAVITLRKAGDGVAYVGRLLARSLADLEGVAPWIATLEPARLDGVTLGERARFLLRIAAAQAAGRVDCLIFNHLAIARTQALLPPGLRVPHAVFLNGVEIWDRELRPEQRRALTSARLRLAISYHTARRVEAEQPDLGPVLPCPLGLLDEAPSDSPVDSALLSQVRPRSALIVGRMSIAERYKGHDELLECWSAVRARVPDAQLVIAGRGDDVPRLEEKARSLGLADAVLFTGFVDESTLEAMRRRVALFTMPSRGEGFGLVYVEAMRSGLPCVAASDDAGGELVVDGETGFVVRQADRDALSQSIATLLEDESQRRAMGESGRARWAKEYTYMAFRNRLAAALDCAFPTRG